jgi:hypothetical protein
MRDSTQQMDQVNSQHHGREDQSIPSLQLLIVDGDGLIVRADLSNNLRSLSGSMLGRDNRSLCPRRLQAGPTCPDSVVCGKAESDKELDWAP